MGTKERGLLSPVAALEIYFFLGGAASAREAETYGKEIAKHRYQANIICTVLSDESSLKVDVEATQSNLNALAEAAERLRLEISKFSTLEEQLELSKEAKKIVSDMLRQS